jgi:hypothetical protein
MYEMTGDFINKYFKHADPTICRIGEVSKKKDRFVGYRSLFLMILHTLTPRDMA